MPPTRSIPLLIRIDATTRNRLSEAATARRQTLSDIVREATMPWVATPDRTYPLSQAKASGMDGFINVRFSRPDMDTLLALSDETGLDRGTLIRCALHVWLSQHEPEQPVAV